MRIPTYYSKGDNNMVLYNQRMAFEKVLELRSRVVRTFWATDGNTRLII